MVGQSPAVTQRICSLTSWSYDPTGEEELNSVASEMLKNYLPLPPPPSGSLVRKSVLDVRQAEREERPFSLMGPASRYSFYANEGDAEVSPRKPTVKSEHRKGVVAKLKTPRGGFQLLPGGRGEPIFCHHGWKTAQAAWKWPEESVDGWISH